MTEKKNKTRTLYLTHRNMPFDREGLRGCKICGHPRSMHKHGMKCKHRGCKCQVFQVKGFK
jgi:hypothetical protein